MNICKCGHYYGTSAKQMGWDNHSLPNTTTRCSTKPGCVAPFQPQYDQIQYSEVQGRCLDSSFVDVSLSVMFQQIEQKSCQKFNKKCDNSNANKTCQKSSSSDVECFGSNFFPVKGGKSRTLGHCVRFLEEYENLKLLQLALETPSNPPTLTAASMKRVQAAVDSDTVRMQHECVTYENAVRDEKARRKALDKAMTQITLFATVGTLFDKERKTVDSAREIDDELVVGPCDASSVGNFDRADGTFRLEIEILEQVCRRHEQELTNLCFLMNEQLIWQEELDKLYDNVAEEQNALTLEAKSFDNEQEQLSRNLETIQYELNQVSSRKIQFFAMLHHLEVDQGGRRYPLINGLRLGYRPKGDVQWGEIQQAWSLAAQLLLAIGTLFEFQSKHCKIVPLSQCAMLIYYPPNSTISGIKAVHQKQQGSVYNLGHPTTNAKRALLTWNALMSQIIHFVNVKIKYACERGIIEESAAVPPLPFEISYIRIGSINLTQIDERDDAGWSRAIHCMASNLQWLSQCASIFVLNEVLLV